MARSRTSTGVCRPGSPSGRVEQAAAVVRRQAHRLAVTGHGRGLDELAVGRVGSAVAVDLQVGEQRPQDGQFAAYGAARHAAGCQPVPPGGDMLRPDLAGRCSNAPASIPAWARNWSRSMLVGAGMSPGASKPATRGRFKTSHNSYGFRTRWLILTGSARCSKYQTTTGLLFPHGRASLGLAVRLLSGPRAGPRDGSDNLPRGLTGAEGRFGWF